MRQVISNRVYRSQDQLLEKVVVVLCEECLGHYYQIEDDDVPLAEWLGGTIFLSSVEDPVFPEKITIQELKELLLNGDEFPCYAYHVPEVHAHSTESFPSEVITRLEEDY